MRFSSALSVTQWPRRLRLSGPVRGGRLHLKFRVGSGLLPVAALGTSGSLAGCQCQSATDSESEVVELEGTLATELASLSDGPLHWHGPGTCCLITKLGSGAPLTSNWRLGLGSAGDCARQPLAVMTLRTI